jgi:hypothetical protein
MSRYLANDRLVGPHIAGFRKPAAQFGLGSPCRMNDTATFDARRLSGP